MSAVPDIYGKHGEAIRYLFFGVLNVMITWAAYAVFVVVDVDPSISNMLSWICGVLFAFFVNKWFVFGCKSLQKLTLLRELASFTGARLFTGVIAIVGFPILYEIGFDSAFMGIDGFMAKMTVTAIEVVLNYFLSKYYIFKKNPDHIENTNV